MRLVKVTWHFMQYDRGLDRITNGRVSRPEKSDWIPLLNSSVHLLQRRKGIEKHNPNPAPWPSLQNLLSPQSTWAALRSKRTSSNTIRRASRRCRPRNVVAPNSYQPNAAFQWDPPRTTWFPDPLRLPYHRIRRGSYLPQRVSRSS